jgi:hypothetical protein
MKVRQYTHRAMKGDPDSHEILTIIEGEGEIHVYELPTGRSVRVYVDGKEIKFAAPEGES